MTITLELPPDAEANLVAQAQAVGLSLERFIEYVLEREATACGANGSHSLTGVEKATAFRAWANSFSADLPVLYLEDVSRENVYRRD
jgi:hypothetical protein